MRDEAEASPAREQALRVGPGLRALKTRDQKVNRVPVDSGTDTVTDGFDEPGDDDDGMQGPSRQIMVHLLGDMVIYEVKQSKVTRRA